MNPWMIWIVGWLVTLAVLTIGTHSATNWTDETKSNFVFRVALLGIILWPIFIAILIFTMIGLYIKKRMET